MVVEGGDSDLGGDLSLEDVDLGEDLSGEGLLDLLDLLELVSVGLVGDEDLDHVSEGLLGGGREGADLGACLIGVSLQVTTVVYA